MHIKGHTAHEEALAGGQRAHTALQLQPAEVPTTSEQPTYTWKNQIEDVAFPAILCHHSSKGSIAYGRSPKADALQGRSVARKALQ